ncbi:peptidase [Kwoniella heveanensis BCC8398]|uniref:Peptidase n=1 Tax=Kwoniella heveanensis BCC8398 TaxID=1296120 RepID=A0A1B9H0D1_9TREE|nr:peptidase [Kwoniella heveanensis BCC8398]
MKVQTVLSTSVALLSALAASVGAFDLNDVKRTTSGSIVPGRYIVEFDSNAHRSSAGLKRSGEASYGTPHEAVYAQLKERSAAYVVHQEYACDLFYGASISLESDTDLANLLAIEGVIDFRPVHLLQLPAQPLSLQDLQWTTNHPSPSPTTGFSNLPQIQADQVHASGNKGKGVQIAIIDGGVDYTRTPLGGCFGSGCKIAGGYDFVGDDYDGSNDPVPDNDPLDTCYTHGSITAGIIGANDNEYNVTGVAPEASLYQYRVFGCNGATTDDIVLQAMQRSYDEGADVINLSVGETSGWTESMLSVFASRLVSAGTIIAVSAGNQGQVGAFYSYSPAAGQGVINVGSSDNSIYPAQLATTSTGYGPITYYNYQAFASGSYPVYVYSSDPSDSNYGCVVPDDTPDLSGYLVVVRRGGCSLSDKARFAYLAGATAIFVVNTPDTVPIYQNFPLINFALVSSADGEYLLSQVQSGNNTSGNFTVNFSFNPIAVPNVWTGNTTSYFSEIGPTNDLFFAPSVVAPGSNIIGVVPSTYNNWSITEGTSWSSAFVAGAAALYLNARDNNVSPDKVKAALEYSAEQLPVSVTDTSLANVAVQGAGRIQIAEAINPGAIVSPAEILLNDTAYFAGVQYLTLNNPTKKSITYKLSNIPAGTALAYQTGLNQSNDQPVPQISNAASVKFSQTSVYLWPGATTVVLMQFTAPQGLDAKTFPIYSGFIQVSGGSTPVQVPYLGVAAKMKDMPVIDPTPYYLGMNTPTILDGSGAVQEGTGNYNFQNGSFPSVMYRLVGGTPLLLIDLVDASANLTFTPNYNSRKRSASPLAIDVELEAMKRSFVESRRIQTNNLSANWRSSKTTSLISLWCQLTNYKGKGCAAAGGKSNTFAKVPILGNLYEADYIPRSTDNADGQGGDYSTFALEQAKFANGTVIPNGTYKFLMRALHITGDRTKEADYEAWVSKPFTVSQ